MEFNGTMAIFDPSLDYLHMNELEFEYFTKTLKGIYGTNITCTENFCYFNVTDCADVYKQNATIDIGLGEDMMHSTNVILNLEDFLYLD